VQSAAAAPSSEHWNDEPVSEEENVNVAPRSVVAAAGFVSMLVSGAAVSTVQSAESESLLPAASVARTVNVWSPSATSVRSSAVLESHGP
jgi:hypothetical protein